MIAGELRFSAGSG